MAVSPWRAVLPAGDGGYPLGLLRHLSITGNRRLETEGVDPLHPIEQTGGSDEVFAASSDNPAQWRKRPQIRCKRPAVSRSGHGCPWLSPKSRLGEVIRLTCRPPLIGLDGGGRQPRKGGTGVSCIEVVVADHSGVTAGGLQYRGETSRLVTPSALSDGQGPGRGGVNETAPQLEQPACGGGGLGNAERLGLTKREDGGGLLHGDGLSGHRGGSHQFSAGLIELIEGAVGSTFGTGGLYQDAVVPGGCRDGFEPPTVELVRWAVGDDHQPDPVRAGDEMAEQPERGRIGPLCLLEKNCLRPPTGG